MTEKALAICLATACWGLSGFLITLGVSVLQEVFRK